jgi:hypothetical protein
MAPAALCYFTAFELFVTSQFRARLPVSVFAIFRL